MAQETEHVDRKGETGGQWAGRASSLLWSRVQEAKSRDQSEDMAIRSAEMSKAFLSALGNESSRRILDSAITCGKTVEQISAEQRLPLSTCYRRVREFMDEGLMILEKMVVTQTGKRYAVYRTSFSRATISFNGGEVSVGIFPNLDIIEKLRRRWLSANYDLLSHDGGVNTNAVTHSRPADRIATPFE